MNKQNICAITLILPAVFGCSTPLQPVRKVDMPAPLVVSKTNKDLKIYVPKQSLEPGSRIALPIVGTSELDPGDLSVAITGNNTDVTQPSVLQLINNAAEVLWDVPDQPGSRWNIEVSARDFPGHFVRDSATLQVSDNTTAGSGETIPIGNAFCGVTNLNVVTKGNATFARQKAASPAKGTRPIRLGTHDTTPKTLRNTKKATTYDYFVAFEIRATLEKGSKPSLCREMQMFQTTKRLNNKIRSIVRKRVDPVTWKVVGKGDCWLTSKNWCDDDYEHPFNGQLTDGTTTPIKKYGKDLIVWFDGHGGANLQGSGLSGLTLWLSRKRIYKLDQNGHQVPDAQGKPEQYESGTWLTTYFRSGVRGTHGHGSWLCTFTVRARVTAASNGTLTKVILPSVSSKHCAPEAV